MTKIKEQCPDCKGHPSSTYRTDDGYLEVDECKTCSGSGAVKLPWTKKQVRALIKLYEAYAKFYMAEHKAERPDNAFLRCHSIMKISSGSGYNLGLTVEDPDESVVLEAVYMENQNLRDRVKYLENIIYQSALSAGLDPNNQK